PVEEEPVEEPAEEEPIEEEPVEEEFLANIHQGGRLTVPLPYRQSLGLEQGTRVRVKIRKDKP
ncbi:unnamed protein product, partial [marine sediment metagenome]